MVWFPYDILYMYDAPQSCSLLPCRLSHDFLSQLIPSFTFLPLFTMCDLVSFLKADFRTSVLADLATSLKEISLPPQ